jgi:hypothetical protein
VIALDKKLEQIDQPSVTMPNHRITDTMFLGHSLVEPMPSLANQGAAGLHSSGPCAKRGHYVLVSVLNIVGASVAID